MILTDNPGELVGNGRRKTVIISPSEASREVALWVGIYKEYLLAESCKSNTQIDRCGRFACAAFLIADSNSTLFDFRWRRPALCSSYSHGHKLQHAYALHLEW